MRKTWLGIALAALAVIGVAVVPSASANHDQLGTRIQQAVQDGSQRGTTAAISYLDRVTGEYRDNGGLARTHFGSASVVKLFIADDLFYRAWRGEIALSSYDWQQIDAMLKSSDDASASRFWSRFGGPSIVDRIKARYRLVQIQPPLSAPWWGLTRLTAFDMALYYARLLGGEGGLPGWLITHYIGRLQAFTPHGTDGFYQRHGLPDGLPGEPVMGVKQGWMCCQYNLRTINSTGVVGSDSRYVVVVFAHDQAGRGYAHTQESVTRMVRLMFPDGRVPRPAAHNPFGSLDAAVVDPETMRFSASGWVIDPDTAGPAAAHLSVGRGRFALGPAAVRRPDLTPHFPAFGPDHGYQASGPMPGGSHQVCGYGINTGPGDADPQLGCRTVTAPQKPFGSLDGLSVSPGSVRVWGWVMESELAGGPSPAHLLVDGRLHDLGWALNERPDLGWTYVGWGTAHGFDKVTPVAPGRHEICVRGVDLRTAAGDTPLGCRTVTVP